MCLHCRAVYDGARDLERRAASGQLPRERPLCCVASATHPCSTALPANPTSVINHWAPHSSSRQTFCTHLSSKPASPLQRLLWAGVQGGLQTAQRLRQAARHQRPAAALARASSAAESPTARLAPAPLQTLYSSHVSSALRKWRTLTPTALRQCTRRRVRCSASAARMAARTAPAPALTTLNPPRPHPHPQPVAQLEEAKEKLALVVQVGAARGSLDLDRCEQPRAPPPGLALCMPPPLPCRLAQDIESAQEAVKGASSAEDACSAAEDLRRCTARTIEDVARMLRAEGPAADIAEAGGGVCG